MAHEEVAERSRVKQIVLSCWCIASFAWYVHRFSPALTPVIHRLLPRIWH